MKFRFIILPIYLAFLQQLHQMQLKMLKLIRAIFLRITVEDGGNGISPEVANRIFDPFFTTKAKDKGTGLGLSISHGIIQKHNGKLWVESVPGQLTRFHIELPMNMAGVV